jgi:hypothetical protein
MPWCRPRERAPMPSCLYNILDFQATKNTSFLKFFLQLCEACSL